MIHCESFDCVRVCMCTCVFEFGEKRKRQVRWRENLSVYYTVGIATAIPLYYSSLYSIIHLLVHIFPTPYIMLQGTTVG